MSRDLCVLIIAELQTFLLVSLFLGNCSFVGLLRLLPTLPDGFLWLYGRVGHHTRAHQAPRDPPVSLQLLVKMLRSISHGFYAQGKAQGLRSSIATAVVALSRAQGSWGGQKDGGGAMHAYSPQNMVLPLPEVGHRVLQPCFGWDFPCGELRMSSVAVTATV